MQALRPDDPTPGQIYQRMQQNMTPQLQQTPNSSPPDDATGALGSDRVPVSLLESADSNERGA